MCNRISDPVQSPAHYTVYPVEPIEITRHLGFCLGNAVKYVLRAPYKNGVEDCDKACQYLVWEGNTPQRSLTPASYQKTSDACGKLRAYLTNAQGDQLWSEIAQVQREFIDSLQNYTLESGRRYLEDMFLFARELGRILSLRDTTGQIYEGMNGMPQGRV